MADDVVTIEYSLALKNGQQLRHIVRLDRDTMALQTTPDGPLPEWTRLEFHQCPNCPLDPAAHPRCPVAQSMVGVVESFKNCMSHEVAEVTVTTPDRTFFKRAPLQEVARSLMGLHMASSGCPIMDKLRPMVSTHLPFATMEETLYRAVSTYLLAQYVRWKKGLKPDWELVDLVANYDAISVVNIALGKRILNINSLDANLNAIASLDCIAEMASLSIPEDYTKEIEHMFAAYLDQSRPSQPSADRAA